MSSLTFKRIAIILVILLSAYFVFVGKIDGVSFLDAVQNMISGEVLVTPVQ